MKGEFVRVTSDFRDWITPHGSPGPTGEGGFAAESGRYPVGRRDESILLAASHKNCREININDWVEGHTVSCRYQGTTTGVMPWP